jgi:hypothetical protein
MMIMHDESDASSAIPNIIDSAEKSQIVKIEVCRIIYNYLLYWKIAITLNESAQAVDVIGIRNAMPLTLEII